MKNLVSGINIDTSAMIVLLHLAKEESFSLLYMLLPVGNQPGKENNKCQWVDRLCTKNLDISAEKNLEWLLYRQTSCSPTWSCHRISSFYRHFGTHLAAESLCNPRSTAVQGDNPEKLMIEHNKYIQILYKSSIIYKHHIISQTNLEGMGL